MLHMALWTLVEDTHFNILTTERASMATFSYGTSRNKRKQQQLREKRAFIKGNSIATQEKRVVDRARAITKWHAEWFCDLLRPRLVLIWGKSLLSPRTLGHTRDGWSVSPAYGDNGWKGGHREVGCRGERKILHHNWLGRGGLIRLDAIGGQATSSDQAPACRESSAYQMLSIL